MKEGAGHLPHGPPFSQIPMVVIFFFVGRIALRNLWMLKFGDSAFKCCLYKRSRLHRESGIQQINVLSVEIAA